MRNKKEFDELGSDLPVYRRQQDKKDEINEGTFALGNSLRQSAIFDSVSIVLISIQYPAQLGEINPFNTLCPLLLMDVGMKGLYIVR